MKRFICTLFVSAWLAMGCSDDSGGGKDLGALSDAVSDTVADTKVVVDAGKPDAAQLDAATMDASGDKGTMDGVKKTEAGAKDSAAKDKAAPDKLLPDTVAADIPLPSEAGVPYGCSAACIAKAPYLCSADSKGQCVECGKDSHCAYSAGALGNKCDTGYGICTCAKDTDCAGKIHGSKCDSTNKLCGCDPPLVSLSSMIRSMTSWTS